MPPAQIPNLDLAHIFEVTEGSAGDQPYFDWTDRDGVPIPLAAFVSVHLTLYDAETGQDDAGAKIRDRVAVITNGVLVAPGVTYTPSAVNAAGATVGRLAFTTTAADTAVRHPNLGSELHAVLAEVVHTGGTFADQLALRVLNLRYLG